MPGIVEVSRAAASTLCLLLATVLLRDHPRDRSARASVFLLAGVVGHVLFPLALKSQAAMPLQHGALLLALSVPVAFWFLAPRLVSAALVIHALIRVYVGAGSDLVLPRRRLRYGLLVVAGTCMLIELMGEVLLRGSPSATLATLHSGLVLAIVFGASLTIRGLAERVGTQGHKLRELINSQLGFKEPRAPRGAATVRRPGFIARQAACPAEQLPYPDNRFDKVLSVHTLYFWSEPARALAEIRRVLKSPGRLALAWRHDPEAMRSFPASVYRFHAEDHVRHLLEEVGFASVGIATRSHGAAVLRLAVASVGRDTSRG